MELIDKAQARPPNLGAAFIGKFVAGMAIDEDLAAIG